MSTQLLLEQPATSGSHQLYYHTELKSLYLALLEPGSITILVLLFSCCSLGPPSWHQYRIWLTEWCYWIIVQFHQQLGSDIWHTADLWPYSHISVLKATTARSPCRKIPNESIKAPFSHPRLSVLGVGLDDTDVLVKDTAGSPAPPGPASATSPSWDSMLTPLTASMGQERSTRIINKADSSGFSHRLWVLPGPLQQLLVS